MCYARRQRSSRARIKLSNDWKIRTAHRTTGTSVVRITNQNETPRGARSERRASAQMGPHSTHSIINSQRASAKKSAERDADSSRGVEVSQGGPVLEFTGCRQA